MTTLQQETTVRDQLKTVLHELSEIAPSSLARSDLGSDLSFESGVVYFSRILRLFHSLAESDLEDIGYAQMNNALGVANSALELFRNIQQFSITKYTNNPIAQRDSFINQARDQYDNIFTQVSPLVAFTLRKGIDFKRLQDQAEGILKQMTSVSQQLEEKLKESVKNADEVLDAVRKVASEAGVSQHAIHFKTEADNFEKSAKPWLVWTVILASATALIGLVLAIKGIYWLPTLTASQGVQLAIPKIFLFSILLSATIWCGKTYRSSRHNAVVNRHRQNALATFEAFVKATTDQPTKNAVLIQATQCIFSPQQTGYIQAEPEVAVPQVLELVRNIGK